jgi:Asp-tRNA(Asn)/Glu-tRNA(Gln) amidotransferase A subunit family amidase
MQHFSVATLSGYPMINVPNGFTSKHTPTGMTFLSRPYGEAELLTLAKAYQDATTWHLQHPSL